jgi:hypothetical protein
MGIYENGAKTIGIVAIMGHQPMVVLGLVLIMDTYCAVVRGVALLNFADQLFVTGMAQLAKTTALVFE